MELDLSHLKLKRLLGRGAHAEVVLASVGQKGSWKEVALKIHLPEEQRAKDEHSTRMFLEEAAVMQTLHSPHILECYGITELPHDIPGLPSKRTHGSDAIVRASVLEFMEAGSLARLVLTQMSNPNRRSYSDYEGLCILLDVALGLQFMHEQADTLVHRDLKMENLLLTRKNGRLQAKIADLGLHTRLPWNQVPALLRRKQQTGVPGGGTVLAAPVIFTSTDPSLLGGPQVMQQGREELAAAATEASLLKQQRQAIEPLQQQQEHVAQLEQQALHCPVEGPTVAAAGDPCGPYPPAALLALAGSHLAPRSMGLAGHGAQLEERPAQHHQQRERTAVTMTETPLLRPLPAAPLTMPLLLASPASTSCERPLGLGLGDVHPLRSLSLHHTCGLRDSRLSAKDRAPPQIELSAASGCSTGGVIAAMASASPSPQLPLCALMDASFHTDGASTLADGTSAHSNARSVTPPAAQPVCYKPAAALQQPLAATPHAKEQAVAEHPSSLQARLQQTATSTLAASTSFPHRQLLLSPTDSFKTAAAAALPVSKSLPRTLEVPPTPTGMAGTQQRGALAVGARRALHSFVPPSRAPSPSPSSSSRWVVNRTACTLQPQHSDGLSTGRSSSRAQHAEPGGMMRRVATSMSLLSQAFRSPAAAPAAGPSPTGPAKQPMPGAPYGRLLSGMLPSTAGRCSEEVPGQGAQRVAPCGGPEGDDVDADMMSPLLLGQRPHDGHDVAPWGPVPGPQPLPASAPTMLLAASLAADEVEVQARGQQLQQQEEEQEQPSISSGVRDPLLGQRLGPEVHSRPGSPHKWQGGEHPAAAAGVVVAAAGPMATGLAASIGRSGSHGCLHVAASHAQQAGWDEAAEEEGDEYAESSGSSFTWFVAPPDSSMCSPRDSSALPGTARSAPAPHPLLTSTASLPPGTQSMHGMRAPAPRTNKSRFVRPRTGAPAAGDLPALRLCPSEPAPAHSVAAGAPAGAAYIAAQAEADNPSPFAVQPGGISQPSCVRPGVCSQEQEQGPWGPGMANAAVPWASKQTVRKWVSAGRNGSHVLMAGLSRKLRHTWSRMAPSSHTTASTAEVPAAGAPVAAAGATATTSVQPVDRMACTQRRHDCENGSYSTASAAGGQACSPRFAPAAAVSALLAPVAHASPRLMHPSAWCSNPLATQSNTVPAAAAGSSQVGSSMAAGAADPSSTGPDLSVLELMSSPNSSQQPSDMTAVLRAQPDTGPEAQLASKVAPALCVQPLQQQLQGLAEPIGPSLAHVLSTMAAAADSNLAAAGDGAAAGAATGASKGTAGRDGGLFEPQLSGGLASLAGGPQEAGPIPRKGPTGLVKEFQRVYNLTAETGSCMYMAPEVYKGEPYNEAVDIFSLGVVMYEVLTRSMLVFTHVGDGRVAGTADEYAKAVSRGYRPEKPHAMREEVWALISTCWAQDPLDRPRAPQVVDALQQLLDDASMEEQDRQSSACTCCRVS